MKFYSNLKRYSFHFIIIPTADISGAQYNTRMQSQLILRYLHGIQGRNEKMYQRKIEKGIRCPLEYGLEIFGGKWNSRIICVLAAKKVLRYGELRREMGNITDAALASALKGLIGNDIVVRKSYDGILPHVEYSLLEKGESVVPILQCICRWAGIFYKEDSEKAMIHCRRCDHK